MSMKARIARAKARIEKGWTQCAFAKSSPRVLVNSDDPAASSWCLLGALGWDIEKVVDPPDADRISAEVTSCIYKINDWGPPNQEFSISEWNDNWGPPNQEFSISEWNDNRRRTKAEILAVLDCMEQHAGDDTP